MFNESINRNSGFNFQTILKDLELDFNEVYNRHENKLKNELSQKSNTLNWKRLMKLLTILLKSKKI